MTSIRNSLDLEERRDGVATRIRSTLKAAALSTLSATGRVTASREIAKYLRETTNKKINVGAQTNRIPGWLNVDVLTFPGVTFMDATKRWPFPNNTFEALLCEHMIEHVSKAKGELLLREAFRTIAPAAPIRLITPNMLSFARIALDPGGPDAEIYLRFLRHRHPNVSAYDAVNMIYYGYGHKHVYSPDELAGMMRQCGFVGVKETQPGRPIDPVFENVEGHPHILGVEANAVEAFALEGRKP
jgi:predicted SAM-dependent methyltransferase